MVPASESWTTLTWECLISHPSRRMLLEGRAGGPRVALAVEQCRGVPWREGGQKAKGWSQVRCWQMAAALRSAHVPGPEPGLAARCLWAPERRVAGWQELHWLCQQRLCSASACASGLLGFPRDGQGPSHAFKHMAMVPLPRERWGTSASCLVSSQTQTIKKGGTSLELETTDLGNFGFPGIVIGFSSGSTIGLEDFRQSWCERGGVRSSCPLRLLWSCCALGMAQLQPWSSSLALELGHPAAPLHPTCY